jgi:PAS domain S-box-containing protein
VSPLVGLFVVGLVEVALGLLVWLRNPGRSVNRWFAAFATTMGVWTILVGLRRSLDDPAAILFAVRVLWASAALIPVTFLQFAVVFPRPLAGRTTLPQAATFLGLFVSGLAFSPWIVTDVRPEPGDYFQPVYGPLFRALAAYVIGTILWALTILARKLRHASGFARAQLQYVFFGAGLAAVGILPLGLVVPLLTGSSRSGVYGPYLALVWLGFTAHSIVRHRLMDVRVAISRSAAYAAGWVVCTGLLVGGAVLVDTLLPARNPTLSPAGAVLLGLTASAFFLAAVPRLRGLADRYLYRPAYDSRSLVREGSRAMGTFADPARVTAAMADLIERTFHPESLAIVVRALDRDAFAPLVARHVDPAFAWPAEPLTTASPLVRELQHATGAIQRDDLAARSDASTPDAVAAAYRAWDLEVAVPVRDGQLMALILIGPKLSGDSFFGDDLDLLETLASELAIGLKNAQLYHEVVSIKEYNERILTYMDSGVIAVREDGVVTTFNPAAERLLGVEASRVTGQAMDGLGHAIRAVLRDSLADHAESETEVTVSHPEGRVLPLVIHTSSLHDHRGRISGAIAVLNDHSRLKALEEDKRRADRLSALGAMATGVAHEIRNPLVAIKTFAELLPERADDAEFRETFAKVAVKEIQRIEQLLGRLRALAVPKVFPLRPLDLQVPIAETLDLLRGEADRRRIRLLVEIEPSLPPVLGEPDQLKQLFLNLFLNALEAMGAGGTLSVTIRVDRDRPDRGLITVRVTDTGPGIPREDLARVFEPFFTTKSQGTGLGLAICRSIADQHRASLWAEAGPAGVGTAFVAQFPALVAAAAVEPAREAARPEAMR